MHAAEDRERSSEKPEATAVRNRSQITGIYTGANVQILVIIQHDARNARN